MEDKLRRWVSSTLLSKCIALLILVLVLFPAAEGFSRTPVSFGIQGGMNFANVDVEYPTTSFDYDFSKRTGMIFGGLVEVELSRFFSIQYDFLYVQKGAVWELETVVPITTTFKLDYIAMPFLFKAKFGQPMFKVNVFTGPNLGFLVNAKQEVEAAGQSSSIDVKELFRGIDFAIDFGGGFEFAFNPKFALFVNGRYSMGVITVYESQLEKWKLNGTQILGGTKISL